MSTRTSRLPNFLYIGPDKAGSTWLAEVLDHHPEVWVAPAKDTYFFNNHYERGLAWYARQFRGSHGAGVVAELCHDYLFSPTACSRIADDLPDVRLMVCLRKPSDRAFSAYLHARKHAQYDGPFHQAIRDIDVLVDHGRYASHLRPYLAAFGRERIYVGIFDDLQADPQRFTDDLLGWLGVEPLTLPRSLLEPRLTASGPRAQLLSRWAKTGACRARALGFPGIVGAVKRSATVQRALYRAYGPSERPRAHDAALRAVDDMLAGEILAAEQLLRLDLRDRWGRR